MTDANHVATILQAGDQARRMGDTRQAVAHYQAALNENPSHPHALNALGHIALAAGKPLEARSLFERAVAADPDAPALWLNCAIAAGGGGDDAAELSAIDRALAIDPYFLPALFRRGQWMEAHNRLGEATRIYRSLLDCVPSDEQLPPNLQDAINHARQTVELDNASRDRAIRGALDGTTARSDRFDHALDILAGRRKVYVHQPLGLHFPYLPAVQFFDRSLFPWFDVLEQATSVLRREYLALRDQAANAPYIQVPAGQPVNQWQKLNNSLDWSAIFLWKDGRPVPEIAPYFPDSLAALHALPMLDIPGRAPTVMISILEPHTHIPPHTGVTNTRAVVHLPLIVPDGCAFRVGSETRHWEEGRAWAFDDTIEHEAFNNSDRKRVIVIIDAWNPFLTEDERTLLRHATMALADHGMRDQV